MTNVQHAFKANQVKTKNKGLHRNLKSFCPRNQVKTKKIKKKEKTKRSYSAQMMTVVKLLGGIFPPIPSRFRHHCTTGLVNIKKISIFDDVPHPFGIETNIAGCLDLTAQIDNRTSIMGLSMYSPLK